jgi:hypothetical protein
MFLAGEMVSIKVDLNHGFTSDPRNQQRKETENGTRYSLMQNCHWKYSRDRKQRVLVS